jgi:ribosomal protein S24E
MELKNIKEIQNPLFNRKEIKATIANEIVPSNDEVSKLLAEKFSVSEDAIKIRNIKGKFGSKVFDVNANVYTSKEELDKTEVKTKKQREVEKKAEEDKRKAAAEEKKKAADEKKAAEEAKKAEAEKPAEEVKEESTEEKTEEKAE